VDVVVSAEHRQNGGIGAASGVASGGKNNPE